MAEQPPSLERDLAQLMIVAGALRLSPEKFAEAKQKLEAKWTAKKEESPDG